MKQKSFFLAAVLLFSCLTVGAQKPGGLSADLLKKIQQAQPSSPADKAIINAVASNNIDDLVKNRANQGVIDTYFSIETPKQSI
ncbi:MAG: aminopeptidase, partial [Hoylesella buccalis]